MRETFGIAPGSLRFEAHSHQAGIGQGIDVSRCRSSDTLFKTIGQVLRISQQDRAVLIASFRSELDEPLEQDHRFPVPGRAMVGDRSSDSSALKPEEKPFPRVNGQV